MVTATTDAVARAVQASIETAAEVQHPAIAVPMGARAALAELVEHLRQLAGCTDLDDVRAELDMLARELGR